MASFVSAGAAYIAYNIGIVTDVDEIIIGNIMTLIPGIGLTNALRDLFTGDSIAGLLRTIEAVLTALAIAAGYFVLVITMGGVALEPKTPPEFIEWLQIIVGTVGTVGFAVLFNIRGKKLAAAALGGFLSWSVFLALAGLIPSEAIRYFLASAAVTVYAEVFARVLKTPTTTFLVPSIIPLIPGGSLYYTMNYALNKQWEEFSLRGYYTMQLALALALGILAATTVFRLATIGIRRMKKTGLFSHLHH